MTSFLASRRASPSTSFTPIFGHEPFGQRCSSSQCGLRAWQTCRPWKIMRWLNIVQSFCGISSIRSRSTFTGSVVLRQAEAAAEPADVRVHGDAGHVEGVAEDDVGGLAADAGSCTSSSIVPGTCAAVLLDDLPGSRR